MPTVEFSFPELQEFLGKRFKPEELKDKISMLGVDLEKIDDEKVVMEVFPNRPDLLSIEGFSRALKGVLDIEKGSKKYPLNESNVKLFVDDSVKNIRPYVVATVVKKVSIDEPFLLSLMDIQEKLHTTHGRNRRKVAIGIHDFSKVEQPFTYKAVKPTEISFVPLDMTVKMNLSEILTKHPKGIGYAFTLEGKEKYPIILDKNKNVLSFPPIINGELTRVTEKTRELFVDITGTDENAVKLALNIIATAIADRGSEIYSVDVAKAV